MPSPLDLCNTPSSSTTHISVQADADLIGVRLLEGSPLVACAQHRLLHILQRMIEGLGLCVTVCDGFAKGIRRLVWVKRMCNLIHAGWSA